MSSLAYKRGVTWRMSCTRSNDNWAAFQVAVSKKKQQQQQEKKNNKKIYYKRREETTT